MRNPRLGWCLEVAGLVVTCTSAAAGFRWGTVPGVALAVTGVVVLFWQGATRTDWDGLLRPDDAHDVR